MGARKSTGSILLWFIFDPPVSKTPGQTENRTTRSAIAFSRLFLMPNQPNSTLFLCWILSPYFKPCAIMITDEPPEKQHFYD